MRQERGLAIATALLMAMSLPAAAAKKPKKVEPEAAPAAAPASDSAQVIRESKLLKEPFADAETVATLPAGATVQIVQRQGAWTEVRAGEASGWLRLLSLRTGASSTAKSDSGLSAAINVARAGASGNTVATGVRGLSKEQITNATPNLAELEKMKANGVAEPEARAFAAPAATVDVPFLTPGDN